MVQGGYVGACLVAVVFLRLKSVVCSTDESSFSADYGDCEEDTSSIADGICDAAVNTAACGFDGGDCCECTCFVGGVPCNNSKAEFSCDDPDAPSDCGPTSAPLSPTSDFEHSECAGYVPHIQDGYCDEANNNAACGFDGGDCCACTCGEDLTHPCGVEGVGFDCKDPEVPSNCSLSLPGCGGDVNSIQNSLCDYSVNNEECGYDGGDCCECTCREYGYYDYCGYYDYDCIDPSAPLECELYTDSPTPSPTIADYPGCEQYAYYIGDGLCDYSSNTLACGWDGGDCCECTCVPVLYSCPLFNCLDPSAETDCITPTPASSSYYPSETYYGSPTTTSVGTGNYDDDSITTSAGDDNECQEPVWVISDGLCHASANTASCGWDGGDCCECTCIDGTFSCGEDGYNCLDPAGVGDCAQPTPTSTSEEPVFDDNSTTSDASLSSVNVGGVFTIAVFGFMSFGALIIGALVFIRRKCQTGLQ